MLGSSVLETWIDQTLREAEQLQIPGIITKPLFKSPMCRYKIDRNELLY
jgi:hypothetical protein